MNEDVVRSDYERKVRERVLDVAGGPDASFTTVLSQIEGADPRLVRQYLNEMGSVGSSFRCAPAVSVRQPGDAAAYEDLPAADPLLGQWWYTSDTLERLVRRVAMSGHSKLKILCLGTPTIAPRLAEAGHEVTVMDADVDVLDVIQRYSRGAVHCISSILPDAIASLARRFDVCLVDPPWYPEEMESFFDVASACLLPGGRAFISLPQLLTRPGVFEEREVFLARVTESGHSVLFLERNCLRYVVPRFEEAAFEDLDGFSGRPWRQADLLELSIGSRAFHSIPVLATPITGRRYSRKGNTRDFRVFMRVGGGRGTAPDRMLICEDKGFSQNVSRRAHGALPDIWTSEKTGVTVEDLTEAETILASWAAGHSLEEAAAALQERSNSTQDSARQVCGRYDQILGLWRRFAGGIGRRTPEEIDGSKRSSHSAWATDPTGPEYLRPGDGFRSIFSRDRDRVLWSGSLRKLAAKTQLFPVNAGDQLRQRLAHSMEVMQLASTIGESFGLDRDLIEAGSIAHDIGHTPFGHAGEHALNVTLNRVIPDGPGFNHYEHGVDIVRYLEGPYQHPGGRGHPGLNLSPEVCECIFKHTYCQVGPGMSHEGLRRISKHRQYLQDGYCHFEGQAVRLADKVSYLISDLEDGIRLGAIDDSALLACRLFHRPPIELGEPEGETLINRFLYQRRNILRVLMEDAISESSRRLAHLGDPKSIRSRPDYVVSHSPVISHDVSEVWKCLQVGRLHKDPRVVAANLRAAKIVSELLLLFAVFPELIDAHFYREHERLWTGAYMMFYRSYGTSVAIPRELAGFLPLRSYIGLQNGGRRHLDADGMSVCMEHLIVSKDYIASLTDDQARHLHGIHLASA